MILLQEDPIPHIWLKLEEDPCKSCLTNNLGVTPILNNKIVFELGKKIFAFLEKRFMMKKNSIDKIVRNTKLTRKEMRKTIQGSNTRLEI